MTTEKTILGIIPGLQATALVGANLKALDLKPKKKGKVKQMRAKKLVKLGITNLVGIGLIKPTSQMINKL